MGAAASSSGDLHRPEASPRAVSSSRRRPAHPFRCGCLPFSSTSLERLGHTHSGEGAMWRLTDQCSRTAVAPTSFDPPAPPLAPLASVRLRATARASHSRRPPHSPPPLLRKRDASDDRANAPRSLVSSLERSDLGHYLNALASDPRQQRCGADSGSSRRDSRRVAG